MRPAARLLTLVIALSPVTPAARADDGRLAGALKPFVDRGTLAGAVVMVAGPDGVLDLQAVGYADVAARTPMATDALFWIASQSKPITAAALMILVDEKKVGLDDPVARHLPEFRDLWLAAERDETHVLLKRPKRPVTVRDLLRHTSGMPFKSALEEPTLDRLPLRDRVRSYAMTPLDHEPGEAYRYSNAGINTAGRVIEVASGVPYETFLRTRLFDPLGMTDTTFRPDAPRIARLARSYRPDAAKTGLEATTVTQLRYPLDDPAREPMPAGGLFSTAADLGRFCRMVLNGGELDGRRYLSAAAVAEMTTRQTDPSIKESYGLGWATGGETFGHGGAYATDMAIDPKRQLVFLFLVQHAGFPGDGGRAQGAFREAAVKEFGGR